MAPNQRCRIEVLVKRSIKFDIDSGEWVLFKEPRLTKTLNVSLTHEEYQELKSGKIKAIVLVVDNHVTRVKVQPFMTECAEWKEERYWVVPYSEKSKLVSRTPGKKSPGNFSRKKILRKLKVPTA